MKNKSLFSRFLTNKKALFIASVIFAFIFWILTADNITKTFTEIPLKLSLPESVAQELEIFSSSDDYVSVTVEGKRVAVDALSADSFLATIDLSEVSEAGEKSYNVDVKCTSNSSVDISKVEPANISLMIDRPMTKTVQVKTDFTYSPEGYYVDHNAPATVEISGPESYVEKVKCAYIGGKVTSHNASSVTNNYTLTLYDNENPHSSEAKVIDSEYLKLSYSNVDVTFKYLVLKENVPFSIKNDEGIVVSNSYFSTSPIGLNVAVPESALDDEGNLPPLSINIGRLSQFMNETYNDTVSVSDVLEVGMVNKSDSIEKISYRLDFSSLITKTVEVPSSRCSIINMPSGYSFTVPEKFDVVVVGTKKAIDSIDPQKMDVIFDFESVKPSADKFVDVPVTINTNVDDLCWAYRQSNTSSVRLNAE